MTRKQLEEKYGVKIVEEGYWREGYRMYSADGCPWEKGLKTLKAVEKECVEWEMQLLEIREKVKKRKGVEDVRKCSKCKYRAFSSWSGIDYCMWYQMEGTEDDPGYGVCGRYEEGKPDCYDDDEYCPSATAGDYGPSNPWDAPGMSVSDFI